METAVAEGVWPEGIPRVGELIAGKYEVERIVGRGGMGIVLGARHVELGQRVAIKLLRVDASRNADVIARFLREARVSAKMQSEHVVRVFDVGRLPDGEPFMVMEYLSGSDLGRFVELGGRAPIGDVVSYVLQACEAVAEAHALGIIHRDIKPANIFLATRPDGSPIVKVLDFGISKVIAPDGAGVLTATEATLGSPLFMSPEQIRAAKDVDLRTDIWSFGVVLYQLLSGAAPFDAPTPSALCVAIANDAPTPPRLQRPDVPAALDAVVMRCLEKLPDLRFQNIGELARALAPFAPPDAAPLVERIARMSRQNKGLADTAPSHARTEGGERGRLLVVDDDSALRHAYARLLRGLGWAVVDATEGHEAIARLGAGAFDAILSDIDMPGLGGVELLRALRARDDRTPVVLMTGGPSIKTAIEAVELGAFRYLVKPLDGAVLDQVLRAATSMSKRSRDAKQASAPSKPRGATLLEKRGAFGANGDFDLLDLVQRLSSTRATGVLTISVETASEIHFSSGDIVDAARGGQCGEATFFDLVLIPDGTFRFDPKAAPAGRTIDRTTQWLLLEAIRRLERRAAG